MSKQYKADNVAAKARVYADRGKGECPYEDGTRIARLWYKWQRHYWNMEAMCDDMAEVYGEWRPDKLEGKA